MWERSNTYGLYLLVPHFASPMRVKERIYQEFHHMPLAHPLALGTTSNA